MFKPFSLGLVTAFLVIFANQVNANPLVYGKWRSVHEQDDVMFSLSLTIEKNRSTLGLTCADDSRRTTVTITVPTEVTADQLIVKGSASDEKRLGDINCAIEMVPMEFDYRFVNRALLLSAHGQTATFDRVK